MREILFRGKRVDNGEWAESEYPYGTMSCGVVCHDFDHETIGQFTGLTDNNGVKIFEGDILSSDRYPYTSDGKRNYFAEVVWFDNCPAFGLYTFKAPKSSVRGISEGSEFIEDDLSDMEIIGNIYDNPELIEDMDIKPAAKRGDAPAEQLALAPAT